MADKFFVFWAYHPFPAVLGAPVQRIHDNGTVEPVGYPGYAFKPVLILPLEEGERRLARLTAAALDCEKKLKAVRAEYNAQVEATLGWKPGGES